ncbi:uncharacterized protein LOC126842086 isoform X3 [Adelges cooleyi]|uniref:uncharacterized protein LOC126842086 isoform X3 n=1 Tax=Adelges cooleyi TaxID=133065 RepID=UPI00217F53B3|nr:uncharacterized protein LOC126842086 isoform X3 [Adelges cooleyi]
MKLIGFFVPFILVNVSADVFEADYRKQVLVTNVSIMEAGTGKLNFMIAVPEQLNTTICIPISDLRPIPILDKLLDYQDFMGWKIRRTLKMKYPNIENNQDFGSLDLTTLAQDRRDVTGPALKNIINRLLDGPVQDIPNNAAIKRMCTLIGLYMSAEFPTSYIKRIHIDLSNRTCTLLDGTTEKIYSKNGGVWEQISEYGTVLQRLKDQLV